MGKQNPRDQRVAEGQRQVIIRDLAKEEAAWRALESEAEKRLAERVKEHDAPEPPYEPVFNRIAVYRFRPKAKRTMTASGLHIPDIAQEEVWPENHGLLLAAGLAAREELRSQGIFVGDIVYWGSFEGEEKEYAMDEKADAPKKVLQLTNNGLFGGEDLKERIRAGKLRRIYVRDNIDDPGQYVFIPVY